MNNRITRPPHGPLAPARDDRHDRYGHEPLSRDETGYDALRPSSTDRRAGAVRPGEPRFDPIAWRQAAAPEPVAPQPAHHPHQHDRRYDRAPERTDVGNFGPMPEAAIPDAPLAPPPVAKRAAQSGMRWSYVATWAGLGAISAAYLSAMAWQRSASFDIVLAPVTETLERLANDIAELKLTTASIDTRERATAARVSAAESRLGGFSQTATALAPPAATAPQQTTQGQRPTNRAVLAEEPGPAGVAPAPVAAVSEPAKPARVMAGMVVVPAGAPGSLVLPSLPAAQAAAPSSEPKPKSAVLPPTAKATPAALPNPVRTGSLSEPTSAKNPTGLLIASGPSLESVRLSWNVLHQNHSQVLGSLEPRVLPAGDGTAFHLIAGPFTTDAEATKACISLRSRGVACRYTDFTGSAL